MRFSSVLVSAILALGVSAVPAPSTDAVADIIAQGVVLREDIPAGIEVHEFNEADAKPILEQAEGTSVNPTGSTTIFKRSDCNGSGLCGSGTNAAQCTRALQGYSDNTAYCGYTSRVSEHCTTIYTCSNYNGNCMFGWWLKQQFNKIYTTVGCGICGSYTIPDGSVIGCRATFNYCSNCKNVG